MGKPKVRIGKPLVDISKHIVGAKQDVVERGSTFVRTPAEKPKRPRWWKKLTPPMAGQREFFQEK